MSTEVFVSVKSVDALGGGQVLDPGKRVGVATKVRLPALAGQGIQLSKVERWPWFVGFLNGASTTNGGS